MTLHARMSVFGAVFPSFGETTAPTPAATPQIGTGSFGATFGAPAQEPKGPADDAAAESIRWDRAWHAATSFLAFPRSAVTREQALQKEPWDESRWTKSASPGIRDAITYLVSDESSGYVLRANSESDSLLAWYLQEVTRHYVDYQVPKLLELLHAEGDDQLLQVLLQFLRVLQVVYLNPVEECLEPCLGPSRQHEVGRFKRRYHAIVSSSLAQTPLADRIRDFLQRSLPPELRATGATSGEDALSPAAESAAAAGAAGAAAQGELAATLVLLDETGLGGAPVQRLFAEVMHGALAAHVRATCAGRWAAPSDCPARLERWVAGPFARFVAQVLVCMQGEAAGPDAGPHHGDDPAAAAAVGLVMPEDVASWQQRAVAELGALRLTELYDIVRLWDEASQRTHGGLADLRRYAAAPPGRAHVVAHFAGAVARRLLHAGASTAAVLRYYLRTIRAFAALDPRGVLLERVARPVRRYLRDRDDTVRIIIGGLLAAPHAVPSSSSPPPATLGGASPGPVAAAAADADALPELAAEMAHAGTLSAAAAAEADADLDFDDMAWQPAPADAGPDYRRGRNGSSGGGVGGSSGGGGDVVGALLGLFDARDVFVKEFQRVLGERLLRPAASREAEARVLALLRARVGEAPLQACEVMLHDVRASARLDALLRREQEDLADAPASAAASAAAAAAADGEEEEQEGDEMAFSALVLSRLFWPALRAETFRLPPPLAGLEARFEAGFTRQQAHRCLTWLPALGSVRVALALADRAFEDTVQPWQASVIYAFDAGDEASSGGDVRKTAAQLEEELAMDEELVDNALTFWVGKLILHRHADGVYTVLERLPTTTATTDGGRRAGAPEDAESAAGISAAAAAAEAEAARAGVSALRSREEVLEEKMAVFWQFIRGMLTNQGAMPLPQIVMMLGFAVPGGFPFSREDLRGFLGRRVDEGQLEVVSGSYKIVK